MNYLYPFYTIEKIFKFKLQSEYFLAHLVTTIYINYHFVWITKLNLNIIKEHLTFKQHLRNTVTELLHWELCTRTKRVLRSLKPILLKGFSILNIIQCKTSKCLLGVTAERGGVADRRANRVCYLILPTAITTDTHMFRCGWFQQLHRKCSTQKWPKQVTTRNGWVLLCLSNLPYIPVLLQTIWYFWVQ